ncbi:magnesium transporter [Thermasporomyces composti]|jgi:magnesium transporter|uniref:Magnesium transporter n=1 Tax=Thermasporomyces composti TaxID=696763 RepID=A0A3D9V8K0_THECX|nr:magnesium transporter [Thermasporomyces composti]REF37799.1 magnesium transporter [Thermasporomyces composti]
MAEEAVPARPIVGTAAEHASTEVPEAAPGDTVADVLALLRRRAFDSVSVIAVVDGERLVGVVPIERLLIAPDGQPMRDLVDPSAPVVAPTTDQERAVWAALRRGRLGVAVVDDEGRYRGVLPPRRLVGVLVQEHEKDLARLGGFGGSSRSAREATAEPVPRRLWHRLPWLVLGLIGSVAAAGVIDSFEQSLNRQILLAIFLPGVVYLADAVGTQTETLVIRGLSVGVSIRTVAWREIVTGALLGVLLAATFWVITVLVWGNAAVATAVALALLAACSIATLVAMALPWILHRCGRDPAFGSGPLATVVQDFLSIASYFLIATALL